MLKNLLKGRVNVLAIAAFNEMNNQLYIVQDFCQNCKSVEDYNALCPDGPDSCDIPMSVRVADLSGASSHAERMRSMYNCTSAFNATNCDLMTLLQANVTDLADNYAAASADVCATPVLKSIG